MFNKALFILMTAFVVSGCMATGKSFQSLEGADDNKAVIYIFRKSSLFNFGGALPGVLTGWPGKISAEE